MPGNFDNIIREVLNSTQSKPVGDVVPFSAPRIMQDGATRSPGYSPYYDPESNHVFPPAIFDLYRMQTPGPSNDANLGSSIVRG